VKKDYG